MAHHFGGGDGDDDWWSFGVVRTLGISPHPKKFHPNRIKNPEFFGKKRRIGWDFVQ